MLGEQSHSLVTPCLDQTSHQKGIQHPLRLSFADMAPKLCAITRRGKRLEISPSGLDQGQHLLEVLKLLTGQRAEGLAQTWLTEVPEHHLHGSACCLAFAVGVIDQHLHRLRIGLFHPGPACWCHQPTDRSF